MNSTALTLTVGHFGMFTQNAEPPFICSLKDIVRYVVVEVRPETLRHEALAIDLMKEVTYPIRGVWHAWMPGLAVE